MSYGKWENKSNEKKKSHGEEGKSWWKSRCLVCIQVVSSVHHHQRVY